MKERQISAAVNKLYKKDDDFYAEIEQHIPVDDPTSTYNTDESSVDDTQRLLEALAYELYLIQLAVDKLHAITRTNKIEAKHKLFKSLRRRLVRFNTTLPKIIKALTYLEEEQINNPF